MKSVWLARFIFIAVLITSIVTTGFGADCYFGPGCLDSSFNGGKFLLDLSPGSSSAVEALAQQLDGKIVFAGRVSLQWMVGRLNVDGTLDTSFGNGAGFVHYPITTVSGMQQVEALAIQPDGYIVAMGRSPDAYMNAMRLDPSGNLDPSFGSGGIVRVSGGGSCFGGALQTDGKILIGCTNGASQVVARLNFNGSLDAGFGSGGVASMTWPGRNVAVETRGVAVQSDGKIVLVGVVGNSDMTVARFTTSGAADSSFGTSGRVQIDFYGARDRANAVAIDSSGRIVVSGLADNNSKGNKATGAVLAAARLLSNGSLDPSFGTGGRAVAAATPTYGNCSLAMGIQSDGKIVMAGYAQIDGTASSNYHILVARLLTDGTLDSSFGTGGMTVTFVGQAGYATGMTIQSDGYIVEGGTASLSTQTSSVLHFARYVP